MLIQELNSTTETDMGSSSITTKDTQSFALPCRAKQANSYNVLVVDDEDAARKSAVFLLEQLGYHNHVSAKSGNEAAQIIGSGWADIVLSDIRMPEFSGIELLQKFSANENCPAFVFISGYDLFEYAQKALQLGALGYLLKPFDEDELREVLDSVCAKIKTNRRLNHEQNDRSNHFLLSLFNHNNMAESSGVDGIGLLNIPEQAQFFCLLTVILQDMHSFSSEQAAQLQEQSASFVRLCFESLYLNIYPFSTKPLTGFLLCLSTDDKQGIKNAYNKFEELLKENMLLEKVETTIISDIYDNVFDSFSSNAKRIIKEMIAQTEKSFPDNYNFEQAIFLNLEKFDLEAAAYNIEKIYNIFLIKGYLNFIEFYYMHEAVVKILAKTLDKLGANSADKNDLEELCSEQTLERILYWYREKINNAFSDERIAGVGSIILRAKQYMYLNLSSPLSLEVVSSHVNLSPNYFSRCFKEETDKTFGNYLLELRIKAAKKLLKQGQYKAITVGTMVGFSDIKYFYKVFKKETGFSPGKFK